MEQVVKIALIPPYSLVGTTVKTNYQLLLPQEFAIAPEHYKSMYRHLCADSNQYVIMDNGAAEDSPISIDRLLNLAWQLRVSEVVIPDVLGDAQATLQSAMDFHDFAVPPSHMPPLKFDLMFVGQGQSIPEVMETIHWASKQYWINSIGIPRHLLKTLNDRYARVRIATIMYHEGIEKPVHFLGASDVYPAEVIQLSHPYHVPQKYIRGMDSSMPFNYTYSGFKLVSVMGSSVPHVSRPNGYFKLNATEFNSQLLEDNLQFFLRHHDGETDV